ncbi:MAG: serine hydrolase, partial [Actinomycetota bacterium]|nr:serine hydrolase [Actinomycetota bacterium]
VVLCEGFGLRDVENVEPVTADTHFPIASDSKAFTAALLCQLADQGRVNLDEPVREVIPWFQMHDPHATALVSARDLLSHRTGLPRHDFIWYGESDISNETVARALRHLEANKPLRQTWQYNNLCYLTAGYLTEVVTGKSWDDALHDQLLSPLGMSATVVNPHDAAVKELAQPYKTVQGSPELQLIPDKNEAGPAGGIVSTAHDMTRWLQARLGQCPDVLTEDALTQLHSPAMVGGVGMAAFEERQPMGYALGCQVESYRGRRIVRHGGNLIGFSSDVSIVPGTGIGIVILTNLHGTALRDALPLMIIDQLLALEPAPWGERYHELMTAMLKGKDDALEHRTARAERTPSSRDLDGYVARYCHPAYGVFEVVRDGDRLVPLFHGLGDLIRLDHRSHDAYDLFVVEFDTALPLTFTQDSNGDIDGLTLGLEAMVAPICFERLLPQADPALVAALVGSYSLGPHTLIVRLRGDELVATVPGAGALVLHSAGATRFTSPTMPSISLEAKLDDTGAVTQLVVDPVGIFDRLP